MSGPRLAHRSIRMGGLVKIPNVAQQHRLKLLGLRDGARKIQRLAYVQAVMRAGPTLVVVPVVRLQCVRLQETPGSIPAS